MGFLAVDQRSAGGGYQVEVNLIPDNPGTLNDDFSGTGPLLSPWQFFQPDDVPDTQIRDGLFQGVITDNTGNRTLWFNGSRGRGNRQAIPIPEGPTPVEIIVENIGIGPTTDPTANMPVVTNNFLFAGLLVSGLSDFNISYYFNVIGHRGSFNVATVETKCTFEGLSEVGNEIPNLFGGDTKGDLRLRIFSDGTIEYAARTHGTTEWALTNVTGVPTPPVTGVPRLGFAGDYVYVSLITYAQDSINLPFVGSAESISSNLGQSDVVTDPQLGDTSSDTQVSFSFDVVTNPQLGDMDSSFLAGQSVDAVTNPQLGDTDSSTIAQLDFDAVVNPQLADINSDFIAGHSIPVQVNPTLANSTSDFDVSPSPDVLINPLLGDTDSSTTGNQFFQVVTNPQLGDTLSAIIAGHLVDVVTNPQLGDIDSDAVSFQTIDAVVNPQLADINSDFVAFQPVQVSVLGEIQSQDAQFAGDVVSIAGEEIVGGEIVSGPAVIEGIVVPEGVPQEMRNGLNLSLGRYIEIVSEELDD